MAKPRSHRGAGEVNRGEVVIGDRRIDATTYEDGAISIYVYGVTEPFALEDLRGSASEKYPYIGVVLIPRR